MAGGVIRQQNVIVESKWQIYECLLYYSFNFSQSLKMLRIKHLGKNQLWVLTVYKVPSVGEERV